MSIIRWDPFAGLEHGLDRYFAPLGRWAANDRAGGRTEWAPSANISETDAEFLIRAELPAVGKDDMQVTFDNGLLTVSGERKQEQEQQSERFHRVESFYGKFSRSFMLPENADTAAIRAESKDGVVTIHVPKVRAPSKKSVEIKVQ